MIMNSNMNVIHSCLFNSVEKLQLDQMQILADFFGVDFGVLTQIKHVVENGLLDYKLSSLLFDDYKEIMGLSGDDLSLAEFVDCFFECLSKHVDVDLIGLVDSNQVAQAKNYYGPTILSNLDFVNSWLTHMIENSKDCNVAELRVIANFFSVKLSDIQMIKNLELNGFINYELTQMTLADFKGFIQKRKSNISLVEYISKIPVLMDTYLPSLKMIQLGAKRDFVSIISGLSLAKIKRLRKAMGIEGYVKPLSSTEDDGESIFNYIENNHMMYDFCFESNDDFISTLIMIAEDLKEIGYSSPLDTLISTLHYQHLYGETINPRNKKEFLINKLTRKMISIYELKGKCIRQSRAPFSDAKAI